MDAGEREALSLAVELNVGTILVDDQKAIRKASQLNLDVLQAQDVILLAKYKGNIPSVKEVLKTMVANGEYLTEKVYQEILEEAGEI